MKTLNIFFEFALNNEQENLENNNIENPNQENNEENTENIQNPENIVQEQINEINNDEH